MDEFESVRRSLRDEPDEARVHRMWRAIEARRAERPVRSRARSFAFAAAGMAAVAILAVRFVTGTVPSPHGGPLTLVDGSPLPAQFDVRSGPRVVSFSDASRLELRRGTRLDVVESSASSVGFALRHGAVSFSVTPDGPRRWRIDCGEVSVEVVGTVFRVERDEAGVRVAVERGAVAVRGLGVSDGVQRLGAGGRLQVSRRLASARTPGEPVDGVPSEARTQAEPSRLTAPVAPVEDATRPPPGTPAPRSRARESEIDVWFAQADAARARGDADAALAGYRRIAASPSRDRRASLAAYAMAQLELDTLGRPEDAARSYALSLALGLPRGMRETAEARRVDALRRAGAPDFREAGRRYLEQYPDGRHRATVERWLAP